MIPRTDGTDEGREQERVSTEAKKRGKGRWALPLLLANRLDANIPYANEESEKAAPEDATLID